MKTLFVCCAAMLVAACHGGAPTATATCTTPATSCGESCVNLASDGSHCGACGTECTGGTVCSAGHCAFQCPPGTNVCGNACTVLASDVANCGACGTACTAHQACAQGSCLDMSVSLLSTSPASGATHVSSDTTVALHFDAPLFAAEGAFRLECPLPLPVAFTVSGTPQDAPTDYVLTPAEPLPTGARCVVTVIANKLTSPHSADVALRADISFVFTIIGRPSVTAVSPGNGGMALPTAPIVITFDQPVVAFNAFTLACPAGTPADVTISPASGAHAVYTLTPTNALPEGNCRLTVAAAGIIAPAGYLSADYVLDFLADVPPAVATTIPASGAVNVDPSANIVIDFNKITSPTSDAFSVSCNSVPQSFMLNGSFVGFTEMDLVLSAPLPAGASCVVTVAASQVTDTYVAMAADDTWAFTVNPLPTVSSTSPLDSATSVDPNGTLTFSFDQTVNLSAQAFTLICNSVPVSFSGVPATAVSAVTLTPDAQLPIDSICTLTATAAEITNGFGQALAADDTITFTTLPGPSVTDKAPANNATSVDPATAISFIFSEAVSATSASFTIECPSGTAQAFTVDVSGSPTTRYDLVPSARLPGGTVCVGAALAAGLSDSNGVHLVTDVTTTFTTDGGPTVLATVPADAAVNVLPSATIQVTFDQSVNVSADAAAPSFALECPSGTPIAYTLSSSPAAVITLTPASALPVGRTCVVTAIAANITDVAASQAAATDTSFQFATIAPPSISVTSPVNGTSHVDPGAAITITFDETVNVASDTFSFGTGCGVGTAFTVSPLPPGGVTTYTLTPSAPMAAGGACNVFIEQDVTSVTYGDEMRTGLYFSFTIAP